MFFRRCGRRPPVAARCRGRRRPCATRCRRSGRRRASMIAWPPPKDSGCGSQSDAVAAAGERGREAVERLLERERPLAAAAVSSRQRGSSRAACGSRPRSTMCETTCRWPCGCMWPPMTPNGPASAPSRRSMPGMIVWYGRLPGGEPVRVARLEREAVPAVLQRDARAGRDDHGAEARGRRSGSASRRCGPRRPRRGRPCRPAAARPRPASRRGPRRSGRAATRGTPRPGSARAAGRRARGARRRRTRASWPRPAGARGRAPARPCARGRRGCRAPAARRRPDRWAGSRRPRRRGSAGAAARPTRRAARRDRRA